jgi:hypothetical protein
MAIWIALLRGINVLGRNKVSMEALSAALRRDGLVKVRTYIQSGNVVFECVQGSRSALGERIAAAVARGHGFTPRVVVLSASDLERAAAGNPFRVAQAPPVLESGQQRLLRRLPFVRIEPPIVVATEPGEEGGLIGFPRVEQLADGLVHGLDLRVRSQLTEHREMRAGGDQPFRVAIWPFEAQDRLHRGIANATGGPGAVAVPGLV